MGLAPLDASPTCRPHLGHLAKAFHARQQPVVGPGAGGRFGWHDAGRAGGRRFAGITSRNKIGCP